MDNNNSGTSAVVSPDGNTSIIISMKTRDRIARGKHGKDTYDSVLNRLLDFHFKIAGSEIVE
jgi:apolipoprotein N-acyltransferase